MCYEVEVVAKRPAKRKRFFKRRPVVPMKSTGYRNSPMPYELWKKADGDLKKYTALLRQYGYLFLCTYNGLEQSLPPAPPPTPFQLWMEAGEDQKKYEELLDKHGLLLPLNNLRVNFGRLKASSAPLSPSIPTRGLCLKCGSPFPLHRPLDCKGEHTQLVSHLPKGQGQ